MRRRSIVLSLLLIALSLNDLPAVADELEIFELKGATPQEIIPLVKPFVGAEGTVTGMHNKLIVRTTAERMAEVRKIVRQFDRAPRRLLLQVRDSAPSETAASDIGLSVHNPHLRLGDEKGSRLRIKRYSTETQETNLRTLQTLEGQPTLISSGISRPVVTDKGYIVGPRASEWTSYDYQTISSGLYATVQLLGERVRIEITTQKQQPISGSPAISQQATANVISGRLGEWLPLAGSSSRRRFDNRGIASRESGEARHETELWVKVEMLEKP